ncbi:MAG TPA: hypothetical protein VJN96_10735 [Vicinamibacterales bacterium]|nr:hypothetical protein [Vicinamibacterales bacterium]
MKKTVIAGVLAVALAVAGAFSTTVAAQPGDKTFSVAVHIAYPDGFEYDGIVARGLPVSQAVPMVVECNQSHKWGDGSAVHFHCYVIPE